MSGPVESWRRLPFSREKAGRQLALSESLLANLTEPSLYWYVAAPPALIVGAAQSPAVLDLATCQRAGLAVYKRTSGGATVWAGPEFLSLDVALPPGSQLADSDLTRAYRWLGQTWQMTLTRLGIPTNLVTPDEARAAKEQLNRRPEVKALLGRVCFGTLSPYEVVVGDGSNRKLVGLAQVRRRAGSLFQSGLPLSWSSAAFAGWFDLPSAQKLQLTRVLDEQAVGLDTLLANPPAIETIIAAFETSLTAHYPIALTPADWTPAELAQADQLQASKYQNLINRI